MDAPEITGRFPFWRRRAAVLSLNKFGAAGHAAIGGRFREGLPQLCIRCFPCSGSVSLFTPY